MTPRQMRACASALDAGVPLDRAVSGTLFEQDIDKKETKRANHHETVTTEILDLARHTGVRRSVLLRVAADSMEAGDVLAREATIAASAARASALVLTAMPLLATVGVALWGVNVVGFLVGQPFGYACTVVGVGSLWWGWRWMARIRARIVTPPVTTGLLFDSVAEIVSVSGIYSETEERCAALADRWDASAEWRTIGNIRRSARDTGTPVAGILRSEGAEIRRDARFAVREQIERLPGRLLAPLGVCLFPAFIALAVIPTIAGMATAALGTHNG